MPDDSPTNLDLPKPKADPDSPTGKLTRPVAPPSGPPSGAGSSDGPPTGVMNAPPPAVAPPPPDPFQVQREVIDISAIDIDDLPTGVGRAVDRPLGEGPYLIGGFKDQPPPPPPELSPGHPDNLKDPASIWNDIVDKPSAANAPDTASKPSSPDLAPPGSSHITADGGAAPPAAARPDPLADPDSILAEIARVPDNPLADGSKVIGGDGPHVTPPPGTSPDGSRWGDSNVIEIGHPKPPQPGADPLATQPVPGEAAPKPPTPATDKLPVVPPVADPGATSVIEPGAKPPIGKPATDVLPNPLTQPGDAFMFHAGAPTPTGLPAQADIVAPHAAEPHAGGSSGGKVLKAVGLLPDVLQVLDGAYRDIVELATGEKEEGFINPALQDTAVGDLFDRIGKASPLTTSLLQGIEDKAGHTAAAVAGIVAAPVQLAEVVWTGGTKIGSEIANRIGLTDVLADGLMSLFGIDEPADYIPPPPRPNGVLLVAVEVPPPPVHDIF